jgi:hypothetical protein
MIFRDRSDGASPRCVQPPRALLLFAFAAIALTGCGPDLGPGTMMVDPGRYSVYHCNDLAARWKVLVAREKELRGLMDKANDGGVGALIGSVAYRSDYESVMTEERLIQREAADKKCDFTPDYQSDSMIR